MVEILAGHRVGDNPRGQLPGTGIRSDGENLYGGNLYGGSAQGVSGTSSGGGGVAVTGESSSGGRSPPVNLLGNGSGGASSSGQASACAGEERPIVCFQIQEIVFQFPILLQQLWRPWVRYNGMSLCIWELMSF